ncbi:MAG: HAMP domain-containing protein, partial [Rhodoferax sp.]|nr:HAMP domain-containing protein [Rhodoferax sp.]
MIQSFRLRLALLSALVTGLALLLFGAGSWWLIRETKIQRLDTELRAIAEREVNRERSAEQWLVEEQRIANSLGLGNPRDVLLRVQDAAGQTLYQSSHWPAAWDPATLPWPDASAAAGPAWQAPSLVPSLMGSALAQEPPAHRAGEWPRPWQRPPQDGDVRAHRPPPPPGAQAPFQQQEPLRPLNPGTGPQRPQPAPAPAPPSGLAPTELARPAPVADNPGGPSALAAPPAAASARPDEPSRDPITAQAPRKPERGNGPAVALAQRPADGKPWHLALARIDVAQMVVAVNAQAIEADMRGIRNAFLLSLPLALLLTGLAGWAFANRALAPIDKLVKATRSVTAGGLEQRIPATGEDREFVVLIEVFNRMLARLERSFQQAHRFTADAAHELKTPLAIVQGQLERAIHQAEDGSAMQTGLSSILDEVRRLSVISRKLLLLSQADAGHLAILREPVSLSTVLEELLEDTRMLAPQLQVDADIQPGLVVHADASLLRQVLHNLVSNAIKYNVSGGWIRIGTARWGHSVEVLVSNASTGIAPEHRARLFERFFRADQAHGRHYLSVAQGLV